MLRSSAFGIAVTAAAFAASGVDGQSETHNEKHSGPDIRVEEDSWSNGWKVRARYPGADDFGTTGETWTLDEAKNLVDEIKKQTADLDEELKPAEILVIGKEGDGQVKEDQGPNLPDWADVEHRFKSLVSERPAELKAELKKLKDAYQEAEKALEEALRKREALADEEVQRINDLTGAYNQQVEVFEKVLFQGRKMPYPRFKPISRDLPLQTKTWDEARQLQYEVEQAGKQLRVQEKQLDADQEKLTVDRMQLVFDDSVGRKTESLAARAKQAEAAADQNREKRDDWQEKKDSHDQTKSQLVTQSQGAQKELLDTTAVVPPADLFTGTPGSVAYTSSPGVKVLKTDDNGEPLPDNKQPEGFPRTFTPGEKVAADERVYVDPELRIAPKPGQSPSVVNAGVYAKVARVDPKTNSVELQIDPFGNRLVYSGVQATQVKVGDYVNPRTPLGGWAPSQNNDPQVIRVRALNRGRWYVNPVAFLQFASQPTTGGNRLTRSGAAPDTDALPTKGGAKAESIDKAKDEKESEKGSEGARLVYDDNAPKRDPRELAESSSSQMSLKEAVLRREMERLKAAEDAAITKLSSAKQKQKQNEMDLAKAQQILDGINPQSEKLKEQAKQYEKERLALEEEKKKLDADKAKVDADAAKLKGSKDQKAIEAYNKTANDYNKDMKTFNFKRSELAKLDPSARISAAKQQREQATKDKLAATKKEPALEAEVEAAQSAADKAKADAQAKQAELTSLASQQQELKKKLDKPADTVSGKPGGKDADASK